MRSNITRAITTVLLLVSVNVFAQTGNVKGIVKTSDEQPAEFATVGLKGTGNGANTNRKGEFELKNIEAGNYTLIVSLFAVEQQEISILVKEGETTIVPDVILKEDAKTLNEIIVFASSFSITSGTMVV